MLPGLGTHLVMLVHFGIGSGLLRLQGPAGGRFHFPLACERDLALSSLACTVMVHTTHVGEWVPDVTLRACWYAMKSFLALRWLVRAGGAHGTLVPLSWLLHDTNQLNGR